MYNSTLTRPTDRVRFLIGDTESNEKLSDQEIEALLLEDQNIKRVAARCAESLAARYAERATIQTTRIRSEKQILYKHYMDLARRLYAQATGYDSFVKLDDTTAKFSVGMHNNNQ